MAGVWGILMTLAPLTVLRRRKAGERRCVGWGLLSVWCCVFFIAALNLPVYEMEAVVVGLSQKISNDR